MTTYRQTPSPHGNGTLYLAGASMPPPKMVKPANGTTFELDELYAMIGCKYVEMLELGGGLIAIFDEEGRNKQLLQNFHVYVGYNQLLLFGAVLVCPSDMFD